MHLQDSVTFSVPREAERIPEEERVSRVLTEEEQERRRKYTGLVPSLRRGGGQLLLFPSFVVLAGEERKEA